MSNRLLIDTCSAFRIAAFGTTLFHSSALSCGALHLHPIVHQESKKWPPWKKQKYDPEYKIIHKLGCSPGIKLFSPELEAQLEVVKVTERALGLVISNADRVQIASVLSATDLALVTDDESMSSVAQELELTTLTTWELTEIAVIEKIILISFAQDGIKRWISNQEPIPRPFLGRFKKLGLTC